jgi:ubiquinone biosynthesis protein COQ9
MTDASESLTKAQDALLDLIGKSGWHAASLAATAEAADVPLADLLGLAPTLFDLLEGFGQRMDIAAIRAAAADGGSQAVRDRLFDLIMARFDGLLPHRDGVRALAKAAATDPGLAAFFICKLPQSMARLLDAAGVLTTSMTGRLQVHALGPIYLSVVRVFLDDDSADLAKTMAALDKALARAEVWAKRFNRAA